MIKKLSTISILLFITLTTTAYAKDIPVKNQQSTSVLLNIPKNSTITLGGKTKVENDNGKIFLNNKRIKNRYKNKIRLLFIKKGTKIKVSTAEYSNITSLKNTKIKGSVKLSELYSGDINNPIDRLTNRVLLITDSLKIGKFYSGQPHNENKIYTAGGWTIGFLPGAMWTLSKYQKSKLLAKKAEELTLETLGKESYDDHDRGFIATNGVMKAYNIGCKQPSFYKISLKNCAKFKNSAIKAADTLVRISKSNPANVLTVSIRPCKECKAGEQKLIIDSLMNMEILHQAYEFNPKSEYKELALKHNDFIMQENIRPDSSSHQVVILNKTTGLIIRKQKQQGLTNDSTWARGQAWLINGLATQGSYFGNDDMILQAVKSSDWVMNNLPNNHLFKYDFSATKNLDLSAQAITAVGMYKIYNYCKIKQVLGCDYQTIANNANTLVNPLINQIKEDGKMVSSAYTVGGRKWDDNAELSWGLNYLAEALVLKEEINKQ